jgi:hypothetical protein
MYAVTVVLHILYHDDICFLDGGSNFFSCGNEQSNILKWDSWTKGPDFIETSVWDFIQEFC